MAFISPRRSKRRDAILTVQTLLNEAEASTRLREECLREKLGASSLLTPPPHSGAGDSWLARDTASPTARSSDDQPSPTAVAAPLPLTPLAAQAQVQADSAGASATATATVSLATPAALDAPVANAVSSPIFVPALAAFAPGHPSKVAPALIPRAATGGVAALYTNGKRPRGSGVASASASGGVAGGSAVRVARLDLSTPAVDGAFGAAPKRRSVAVSGSSPVAPLQLPAMAFGDGASWGSTATLGGAHSLRALRAHAAVLDSGDDADDAPRDHLDDANADTAAADFVTSAFDPDSCVAPPTSLYAAAVDAAYASATASLLPGLLLGTAATQSALEGSTGAPTRWAVAGAVAARLPQGAALGAIGIPPPPPPALRARPWPDTPLAVLVGLRAGASALSRDVAPRVVAFRSIGELLTSAGDAAARGELLAAAGYLARCSIAPATASAVFAPALVAPAAAETNSSDAIVLSYAVQGAAARGGSLFRVPASCAVSVLSPAVAVLPSLRLLSGVAASANSAALAAALERSLPAFEPLVAHLRALAGGLLVPHTTLGCRVVLLAQLHAVPPSGDARDATDAWAAALATAFAVLKGGVAPGARAPLSSVLGDVLTATLESVERLDVGDTHDRSLLEPFAIVLRLRVRHSAGSPHVVRLPPRW